jgi:cytochrome c oxidase cbb3-type subunit 3
MTDASHPEIDAHTGTATTGHDWDGIKELNTPLPRWWLWTFYASIVFAIGYGIAYPAWPLISGSTEGALGWHSRSAIVADMADLKASRAGMMDKIAKASLADIEKSPDLLSFARASGSATFAINCAPCHGAGGQGSKGYPNLNADRWLWGGTLDDIQKTLIHGVRWDADPDTRVSQMPAFGRDGILKPEEIAQTAGFVRTLSGQSPAKGVDAAKGGLLFAANCAVCHGAQGKGNKDLGAPDLTTKVWLYGSDTKDIINRIENGGGGVMPAWGQKLDEPTLKAVAVFVHSLGGGK